MFSDPKLYNILRLPRVRTGEHKSMTFGSGGTIIIRACSMLISFRSTRDCKSAVRVGVVVVVRVELVVKLGLLVMVVMVGVSVVRVGVSVVLLMMRVEVVVSRDGVGLVVIVGVMVRVEVARLAFVRKHLLH